MPWGYTDAIKHTKKAKSRHAQEQWSTVANKVLHDSGDDGKAIRIANAAIAKHHVGVRKFKRGDKGQ